MDVNVVGGANDGTSWANAYRSLSDALDEANTSVSSRFTIRIARGVYYPRRRTCAHQEGFQVERNGIRLLGGYDPATGERKVKEYVTVLSGDRDQDDVTNADGVTESYTDIRGTNSATALNYSDTSNLTDATVLSGVVISGGHSGGLKCARSRDSGCGFKMVNLTLQGNSTEGRGGGAYLSGDVVPELRRITFIGNYAEESGGGLYVERGNSLVLEEVTFVGNEATDGGGMHLPGATGQTTLANVTFEGNTATERGGGVLLRSGNFWSGAILSARWTNVSFYGNRAAHGGGVYVFPFYAENSWIKTSFPPSELRGFNVIFSGKHATEDGGAAYVRSGDGNLDLDFITVNEAQRVTATVYDLLGRRVRVLHDGRLAASQTERFRVPPSTLPSGPYFVRVVGEKDFIQTLRLVVVH